MLAKRYASRARRKPIAALLLAASSESDQPRALLRMCSLLTAACFVPDEQEGRPRTYAMGASFAQGLVRGALALARRGSNDPGPGFGVEEDVRRVLELAGPLILSNARRTGVGAHRPRRRSGD